MRFPLQTTILLTLQNLKNLPWEQRIWRESRTLWQERKHDDRCFDPAFTNTAVAKSKITYIDGEKGVLRYRGYNIEDLAENASFLEVAYLLLFGELPSPKQFADWESKIMSHTFIHEDLIALLHNFRYI